MLVYQETYNQSEYQRHHLHGRKQDFHWRLSTPERIAEAEIDKIGLGVLTGLSASWRTDCVLLAVHLAWLQQRYWQTRFVISFPRLRPCAGGTEPACQMSDAQLLQVICAFRLFAPEVELSLSTRESAELRDNLVPIAINTISAGSRTSPGGYAGHSEPRLEQFTTGDQRSPQQVAAALCKLGMQPVWKDWDHYLGRGA